jgi:SAM-dependent methyltransferase
MRYATWDEGALPGDGTADLVFSHAVLNLVEDLDALFASCARWVKPGGWMSHQIDLCDHGIVPQWYGQLCYSDRTWRFLRGRRAVFANRERCSGHLRRFERHGFEILAMIRKLRFDGLPRELLAERYRDAAEDDLRCTDLFVVARKRR